MTWYLCFSDAERNYWWTRFLKDGFHHVKIIRKDCAGYFWMVIDPATSHIQVEMIPCVIDGQELSVMDAAGIKCTIVEYRPKIDLNSINFTLSLNTCVDTAKRLVGIQSMFIVTPYQLYKRLTHGSPG